MEIETGPISGICRQGGGLLSEVVRIHFIGGWLEKGVELAIGGRRKEETGQSHDKL